MLKEHYGDVEWIYQAREAVVHAVTRAVEQLSKTEVIGNNGALNGRYAMPARTAAELKETADQVPTVRSQGQPNKEVQREQPVERQDDGSMSWVL